MGVASANAVALRGALGHLIDVEADVSTGQAGVLVVGRADAALREGQERVRMAVINSGLEWPTSKRVTVLLAPADLPKSGTHFDLAMAMAVLAADDQVDPMALAGTVFVGELTLAGGLRPALGVLPMVLAAAERGIRRAFVPETQVEEAALVPGVSVYGVRSLGQVVAQLRGEEIPQAPPVAGASGTPLLTWRGEERLEELDLADLVGMTDEKYALEVAAAGGHPLLLSGAKGSGKTSLAERIPTILPDLAPEESLELTAIHSLAGVLSPGAGLLRRPPFAAPHHDASKASLIGGGTGMVRPGAISQAHAGVLFLDEFALFRSDVIEALRQPLESGEITVARREESVTLPARTILVLAANPCPCGDYVPGRGRHGCTCPERLRRDYRRRVSGPIADRIDITRHVLAPTPAARDRFAAPETSAEVRSRVAAARDRQADRFAGRSWRLNSQVPGPRLADDFAVDAEARAHLDRLMYDGRLSARGVVRVLRLAWTVADLRAAGEGRRPDRTDVEVALRLRAGDPLDLPTLGAASRVGR
ncbi:ATP-binding protein [Nocardioides sp. GY 10113]|uniref:YifB family Mg chelatase-like AAA ATPase n=1 Tax=Nocardioides sp. GY 10113 TaxID=2569761 RepID=UPI0010A86FE6|nr:YifB family Mg chelatase-like AAA ATPase [Nocardioides sp. GY 10113]TIC88144.1 ATP-binding protein [Nocardioides sp. GY 10113]